MPNSRAGIMDCAARPEPLSDMLVGCVIVRVLIRLMVTRVFDCRFYQRRLFTSP